MKPTESELAILTILWRKGPSTVREVNRELNLNKIVGYTNTLKMMQIMHEKGMLERDESSRSHVYSPTLEPDRVKTAAIRHMVDTLFDGSTSQLLVQALGNYQASGAELDEIRNILDELENSENDV